MSDIALELVDSLKVLDPDGRLEKQTYAVQQIAAYSITSSPCASGVGGMVTPRALAVWRL